MPLSAGPDALLVSGCEVTIVQEKTDKRLYFNWVITHHPLDALTVPVVVDSGRARCKTENESHNVLKNYGYQLGQHNCGHGKQYLSAVLLLLNLLAFPLHTILHGTDVIYLAVRQELDTRQTFFNDLRTLTRYMLSEGWSGSDPVWWTPS